MATAPLAATVGKESNRSNPGGPGPIRLAQKQTFGTMVFNVDDDDSSAKAAKARPWRYGSPSLAGEHTDQGRSGTRHYAARKPWAAGRARPPRFRQARVSCGFNLTGVTSLVWLTYPVVHFNQVPSSIEIVLLDHLEQLTQMPGTPAWGAGEPTIGAIPPAIANAIFNAINKRLTVLPITSQRVLTALQTP